MAYAPVDDKLMVFHEYNPLMNGVNPPRSLFPSDQLLRRVEQTYSRSITKLGFQKVVQIMDYLIQRGAFRSRQTAEQLLGFELAKAGKGDRSEIEIGNKYWVPVEL